MDDMTTIIIWTIVLDVLVGVWAANWGRSGVAWFFISALLSVLISIPLLLICGKTLEKKAAEMKLLKQLSE